MLPSREGDKQPPCEPGDPDLGLSTSPGASVGIRHPSLGMCPGSVTLLCDLRQCFPSLNLILLLTVMWEAKITSQHITAEIP